MPVYNSEPFLESAINSILAQTFTDFELIIAYDQSDDNSLSIIETFEKSNDKIIVSKGVKRGLIKSLNDALLISKGKYIARMDADDISLPLRFEKQIEFIEKNNLDICGCHYFLISAQGNIDGLNLTPLTNDLCFLSLASKVPFAHPSVMIRKSFLKDNRMQYGQYKYKVAEDLDLWIRMYEQGAKFGNVNEVLFKYRVVENSLSKVNCRALADETKKIFSSFLNNNKKELFRIVKNLPIQLNSEEKGLVVRYIYKMLFKTFNISLIKYLKPISKKIVVYNILSEIANK
jgi:glycosyltransferase involved in cell wall biosynthesis